MSQIHDPTANCMVPVNAVLQLPESGGPYTAMLSPKTGQWFVQRTWTGATMTMDEVADDQRDTVMNAIVRYELVEELCARVEMMRALEEPTTITESESRHTERTRVAAFTVAVARGYAHAEVAHAYATLDRLTELAEATLGARHLETDRAGVTDSITVTAEPLDEGGKQCGCPDDFCWPACREGIDE